MTPEEWRHIKGVFQRALELSQAERTDWLAGQPDAVRREVESLLRAHEHNNVFPATSSSDTPPVAQSDQELIGRRFGPYRVLSQLGEGGMGTVWLAERVDGLFTRRVALKLVHPALMGRSMSERVAREREILASLNHPNIAQLFDAGFAEDGQPYLALEYVEGTPLTKYCDVHHLGISERLVLFRQVLGAVQYAHAHLVIHRDLKPSNILVSDDGKAHLLDFGIAKLLTPGAAQESQLTQIAGRALTPDYAAPEQIAGAATSTAADVYALGVILYELLSGERPYRLNRPSRGALEEAILQTEPVAPSRLPPTEEAARARATNAQSLARALKGDLDTIIGKALKKSPGERYASSNAFDADIARFLAGETVLARPDSVVYRARKFAARHRVGIAGVSLLIIVALGLAGLFGRPYLFHSRNIVAYSPEDRRMTFAILPFQAPRGDPIGQALAASTFDVMATAFDNNSLWGQVAPRRSVDEALARLPRPKDIATALDVHFLIRGTIANTPPGYTVNVLLVDGAGERVLGARSFLLPANAAARPRHVDASDAFFGMVILAADDEVKRALDKPADALDVRDLSLRAFYEWRNRPGAQAKLGYTSATQLLRRALALAPDDLYATYLTVKINLCDCAQDWSSNIEEQRAIGAAALEKLLAADSSNLVALKFKVLLLQLRGRYEESLLIANTILQREPDEAHVLDWKAVALLRLGRPREAQPIADALASEVPDKWSWLEAHAADIHYALGDYATAAQLARGAIARMSEVALHNSVDGTIRLTLAASEARLGHPERAAAALADFQGSVPQATTLAAIRKWMNPLSALYGYEPLFEGLRLARVPD
jgi:serine/threonine protein kinase/TolB-like protein